MTTPEAGSLAGQLRQLGRAVLLAVLAATLLSLVVLVAVYAVLVPRTERLGAGTTALRQAHLATLDQETGLRAYLLADDERFLQPYRAAVAAQPGFHAAAERAFRGDAGELARLREVDELRTTWQLQWARPALGGLPPGTDAASFLGQGKAMFDAYRAAESRAERGGEALRHRSQQLQLAVVSGGVGLEVLLLAGLALAARRQFVRLRHGLVGPVDGLLATMQRLRAGEYGARAQEQGPAELRQVGAGLSELAATLETEQRTSAEREGQLVAARLAAEHADAAKSTFLATMSHEIRTPLNAVIGMTGLLLDSELSAQQRDFTETVRTSGEGLLTIINDVLDFSKLEAGQLDLEQAPFSVRECVEGSLDLVAAQAADKLLDLAYALDPDVPPVLVGDAARLRQVLANLLSNAVKFTDAGEVVVTVQLLPDGGPSADGDVGVALAVRDTGAGIAADRFDRLFRSFSQVDTSTTRTHGGTGLGLAISRRIMEAMGGSLDVESAPGTGSTFTARVHLPRGAETEDGLRVPPAELPGRSAYVLDDNATNRRILRAQLEGWGMRVTDEEHPLAAVAAWQDGARYDVVVLDMHMPDLDGMGVRALPHGADVPLVMLTSLGQRPAGSGDLGLVHLTKPVKAAALRSTLARVLGGAVSSTPVDAAPRELPRLRLLLAEDNVVNQKVATLLLERLGQRPDVVSDGAEAVAAVLDRDYDLVLMDVRMPVLDGLEATRRIRAGSPAWRQPRIVAMTANALAEDREACLAAGMDEHLGKPVRPQELAALLRRTAELVHPAGWPAADGADDGADDAPAVDPGVLDALTARLGARGAAVRTSLVDTWLRETEGRLVELRAGTLAGDADRVATVAHAMRSGSAALGALRLAAALQTVELDVRAGRPVDLTAALPGLEREVAAAADGLRTARDGRPEQVH